MLLAPHIFVEDLSVASIAEAKVQFETTNLPEKLAPHHRDAAGAFWGWNNIWLHPDFRRWNIEAYLPRVTCPILAIQGLDDQYGTMAQINAIQQKSGGPVEILVLPNCRHSPQRDEREATVTAIATTLRKRAKMVLHSCRSQGVVPAGQRFVVGKHKLLHFRIGYLFASFVSLTQ